MTFSELHRGREDILFIFGRRLFFHNYSKVRQSTAKFSSGGIRLHYVLRTTQRRTKSGHGLRLTGIPEKLQEDAQGTEMKMARQDFGDEFIRHQESVPSFILISGRHMKKLFLGADIFLPERTAEMQAMSNGSI